MSKAADKFYVRMDDTEQVKTFAHKDPNQVLTEIIGSEFADYRQQFETATRFEKLTQHPTHIDFELSYGCNLRCPMCVFGLDVNERPKEPEKKQRDLSIDSIKNVITEGIPVGLKSIGVSYYNEPLLKKGVLDLCRWALKAGILDIHFVTNATLLTEEISRQILDIGITRLSFSLDAISRETYAKVRVGADYDQVHSNINRFLELKRQGGYDLPLTRVSLVRTRLNEHEVEEFIAYWKDRVDYYVIQEYVNITPIQEHLIPESKQSAKSFRCPQPWQRTTVRSDGTVLPCCSPYGMDLPMGNIHESSLGHIWNSSMMRELQELHKSGHYYNNPACNQCARNSMV